MKVSVGPITDEQTLDYSWTDNTCTWDLIDSNQLAKQHGVRHADRDAKGTCVQFDRRSTSR